jgi:hypothetical protein
MVTPGIVFFLCSENLPNFIFRKLCWKKKSSSYQLPFHIIRSINYWSKQHVQTYCCKFPWHEQLTHHLGNVIVDSFV